MMHSMTTAPVSQPIWVMETPTELPDAEECCIICAEPLRLELEDEEDCGDVGAFVYDDVQLSCRHRLHYECALETHGRSVNVSLCPKCSCPTLSSGKLLVTLRNEEGEVRDFDLGAEFQEQRYLALHPQEAHNEVFLSMALEGDLAAVKEALRQGADLNATQKSTGMTALHLCALNNDAVMTRFLVDAGADTHICASIGINALQLAMSEGSHDAAYALQ